MALYAIGDLHLSLSSDKPMSVFSGWENYVEKLENNWKTLVSDEDTVVIPGDISWAMSLENTEKDFAFIHALPGKKLILKGNHDYWWCTRRKMDAFLEEKGFSSLRLVHNDAVKVGNIAVCGSRGWFYDAKETDRKVLLREAGRLRTSITAAKELGGEPVVFLHYPPLFAGEYCTELLDVLRQEKIERCYYGHIHSQGIRLAFNGNYEGTEFRLVSADGLGFCPLKIE